ncbi:unnamed protein product [Candidula unifasciata]|uniref:Fucosyltransferase n=1 Tax=Candidula unifasciata TaxID=100452 RepID=A0A8S3ZTB2_9EUPU|nr:unnamed protein product [Candidula unifasciata]
MAVYCISLSDMKLMTSTLTSAWNLTNGRTLMSLVWLSNKSSDAMAVEEEDVDEVMELPTFVSLMQNRSIKSQPGVLPEGLGHLKGDSENTISSLLIDPTNNGSTAFTEEAFSKTSTMTFNHTVVVHCKESPYIECFPPALKPITNNIFKITFVRRPVWLTEAAMNLTNCKFNQCTIQKDNDTSDTDIVIIYGVGLQDSYPVPRRTTPHQLFAIYLMESPVHTHAGFIQNARSPWNNQINMLMSYRLDGDMFYPYYKLRFNPKPMDQRPNYYEIARRTTRTAVWLVSNCKTPSRRSQYVQEMQKFIDVDIFGGCGTPCKGKVCNDWTTKYKFYLAFENSLCTDYVSEKFFKLFDQNTHVIPVVRGGADYDKHFPNFTYVNSAHFKTAKDLALHLKHLASDLETYSKYLEYKDLYSLVPFMTAACKICTFLHTHRLPKPSQTYNLTSRLGVKHCRSPTDLS